MRRTPSCAQDVFPFTKSGLPYPTCALSSMRASEARRACVRSRRSSQIYTRGYVTGHASFFLGQLRVLLLEVVDARAAALECRVVEDVLVQRDIRLDPL